MPEVVGLERAARTLGAWCWAERRCFEVLGAWVHDTPEPALKALFARHSRHHAWRAERWAEILPRAYVPPEGDLIAVGTGAEVFDLMGSVGPSARRLVAHYDVLCPALLSAYESSPAGMHPVTDGPALRAIRIVVGDMQHDLDEASSVRRQLIGGTTELSELVQLREAVAACRISEVVEGMPLPLFRRWGS